MYNTIAYSNLRKIANTGDPLLFNNKGLVSDLIKFGSKSIASHIGFVIKDVRHDILYIMESTTITSIKGSKSGVNISLLSERLETCGCDVYHRPLLGVKYDNFFDETLTQFRIEMKDKKYEKNLLELIGCVIDFKWLNKIIDRPDLTTIFCSELLAELYQRWLILESYPYSNEYTPADFCVEKDGCDGALNLPWLNGVCLGEQKRIIV